MYSNLIKMYSFQYLKPQYTVDVENTVQYTHHNTSTHKLLNNLKYSWLNRIQLWYAFSQHLIFVAEDFICRVSGSVLQNKRGLFCNIDCLTVLFSHSLHSYLQKIKNKKSQFDTKYVLQSASVIRSESIAVI